ncbi:hypothetical protein [Companilactobacillus mishanensis]|uniref:Uncharacterized protein n=1 Tax=Companilactobacillus mishanensis TaxID=2486008 RepID=A0A5P0ZGK2_9LACO|nr:hypothetical protein [Companilactobacillus mishanensis]MQS52177.1 hypothetical protein [Companilactobacillus mishanensis]
MSLNLDALHSIGLEEVLKNVQFENMRLIKEKAMMQAQLDKDEKLLQILFKHTPDSFPKELRKDDENGTNDKENN